MHKVWGGAVMVAMLGGCAGTAPVQDPPALFDGWYAQQAVGNPLYAPGLWPLLASRANFPVLDAPATAGLVHLHIDADQQLTVRLQQGERCVGQLSIAGNLDGTQYRFSDNDFNGIPLLAWGHNSREVTLDLSHPTQLPASIHTSSFGMFLIIAGGAPDRDVTYRYTAITAPEQPAQKCPAPAPGR
ncbi:hypothetical protein [Pseudomonas turukhanskensis]|uniref:Lipoprotein n=1 Tax=Pseudomonas turukhanskensis TaxID=1806536 RepID=A0A9W6K6E2_9PSED|nr:hypothetical protein [Pseudomonas turukhanskensis]GLK87788.1 hypothetical protein GCM10017655_08500 [Pseudomonas turukhanskensis]